MCSIPLAGRQLGPPLIRRQHVITTQGRATHHRTCNLGMITSGRSLSMRQEESNTGNSGTKPINLSTGAATSRLDRKSTRLNSSHGYISYAVFCLKKKKKRRHSTTRERADEG